MIKAKRLGIKPPGLFSREKNKIHKLIKDRLRLLLAQALTRIEAYKASALPQQHK